MIKRVVALYLVLVIPLMSLPFLLSTDVSAAGNPNVTLTFENEIAEADVSPGESGTVTFNGIAECDPTGPGQNVQNVIVRLEANTEYHWGASVNPPQLEMEPGSQEDFQVIVTVPMGTSATLSDIVTVSGTAMPNPGTTAFTIPPETGIVRVIPFVNMEIFFNDRYQRVFAGNDAEYRIRLTNLGNCDALFTVSLMDSSSPEVIDWPIEFSEDEFVVQEKTEHEFEVKLEVPEGAKTGLYDIYISLSSNNIEDINDMTQWTLDLSLRVDGALLGIGFTWGSIILVIILIVIGIVIIKKTNAIERLKRKKS